MPFILFRYSLKEVVIPTLVALFSLTFVIFMTVKAPGGDRDEHLLWMLMRLFLRDDIPNGEVLSVALLVLPSTMIFILPMALLIGIIIGIGRMTLDLEIRSIQTSGIPVYYVFAPILGLGILLSATVAMLTHGPEPRMVRASITRVSKILIAEFSNLEAGRVYDEIFGGDAGMNLYFESRDPETDRMQAVSLMMDRNATQDEAERKAEKKARKKKEKEIEKLYEKAEITIEEMHERIGDLKIARDAEPPIMILAGEASLEAVPSEGRVELSLYNGSIHLLGSDTSDEQGDSTQESDPVEESTQAGRSILPGSLISAPESNQQERDYVVVEFGQMIKNESILDADTEKIRRARTTPELWEIYGDETESTKQRQRAKATVLERYSLSLECFILAFIGLPLAVWVRPSGKSLGVIIAFLLILVYHWLQRTGYSMVESDHPLGGFVIFSPNLLFFAGGIAFWYRALRA